MAVRASALTRRCALHLLAAAAPGVVLAPWAAAAQELNFFRIGTGGPAGTFHPVATVIAHIISSPPGSRSCDKGGSCGVPGLVGVAQSSEGSIANARDVDAGRIESGFCQSDIVFGAYHGSGVFEGLEPLRNIRLIASLYPRIVQIVARRGAGIDSIADLAGKSVSLDSEGSGTLVDALLILRHFGILEDDLVIEHMSPAPAASRLRAGELDAFVIIAGYPSASVADPVAEGIAKLLPIPYRDAIAILTQYPFFSRSVVPEGVYADTPHVPSLAIGTEWIASSALDEALVYGVTAALWNERSRAVLDAGHPAARQIKLSNALRGAGIPLHPGARRYYGEVGLDLSAVPLPDPAPSLPALPPGRPSGSPDGTDTQ